METFDLTVETRTDKGKGASRRLRRARKVPGIIYGGGKEPLAIALGHDDLMHHAEYEAFYSHVLNLDIDGSKEQVVVKDLQRHPFKRAILHVDFQRVSATEKLRMHVPLHFLNEEKCVGVKEQGGVIMHLATEVEVSCLAKDLPEYIEVDVTGVHAGESIHLSDLDLPEGVELVALGQGEDHDLAVMNVQKRGGGEEEETAAEETGGEGGE